jgi:tetratricopeptide (TPR) repeat protein
VFYAKARGLLQDEHFAEAIEQFTEALKRDPSLALAYNGRGYAKTRLRRYAEAIKDFDEAIRLNPNYANAYVNRSAARRLLGDKAGADADQAKAREALQKSK